MAIDLQLLPRPHSLTYSGGTTVLPDRQFIVLGGPAPPDLFLIGERLQQALQQHAEVDWSIVTGKNVPADRVGLRLSAAPQAANHPQGYRLAITPTSMLISAGTAAGLFYGGQTLIQMLAQGGRELPQVVINDRPDFPNRGVMLDISRDKVPTLETLFDLIDLLASWKFNQLQLYTEHTFAYQAHPEVWAETSPLTGQEILALDDYCRARFIELVPNQNSFGHMRRWLTLARYNHLAECPAGCDTEWGYFDEPFTLCPGDPGSLDLLRSLMDELLPHFSSRQFNVGCDETVDLGQGRSRAVIAERGQGRVYLDFLLKIYREVSARGRTMQFWGDIIMAYPELVSELPPDVIALEWGYEADHAFADHSAKFAASGLPFYVCPGTSSWNTIAGRTNNALENLRNAAEHGLKHGAAGYLITDWGDNGHWQPLPVSYLGWAYGAGLAWAYDANREQDMAQAVSLHAFRDPTGILGRVAYDLGNAYLEAAVPIHNNSVLFRILQESPVDIAARAGLTKANLEKTLNYIDEVTAALDDARPNRPDADLIRREFRWAADMLRHACRRGIWSLGQDDFAMRQQLAQHAAQLQTEHRQIWLARNRSGGLSDSQARFEKMRRDYDELIKA
jgi:hypothetical protein